MDVQITAHSTREKLGLLTEEEMAAVLLLNSVTTLATWRSQKRGPPYIRLGKRIFYVRSDFAAWVIHQAHEQHANDNSPPKEPHPEQLEAA